MNSSIQRLVAMLALLISTSLSAAELTLSDVLPQGGDGESPRVIGFDETQSSPALQADLHSSGVLIYEQDSGILRKRVEQPSPAEMIVDGDTMMMISGGRTRSISLRKRPEVRLFFDSLRALLVGDEATLRELFAVQVSGSPCQWTVELIPHSERLSRVVSSMVIRGQGSTIETIETLHRSDERRLMRFRSGAS